MKIRHILAIYLICGFSFLCCILVTPFSEISLKEEAQWSTQDNIVIAQEAVIKFPPKKPFFRIIKIVTFAPPDYKYCPENEYFVFDSGRPKSIKLGHKFLAWDEAGRKAARQRYGY